MEILIPVIVVLALAVGGYVVVNRRLTRRPKPEPPHVVGPETEPESDSEIEPNVEVPPPLPVEACKPGLTVNGVTGVVGAAYVEVPFGQLPSKLTIQAHDCPHAKREAREQAAYEVNFTGVSSGYGSGELKVTLKKLGGISREFARLGSSRVQIKHGTPTGDPDNSVYRIDELNSALATIITKPSRRKTPTDQVDSPITIRMESRVSSRAAEGEDIYPVEVHVNLLPSDGSDQLAVVFREA